MTWAICSSANSKRLAKCCSQHQYPASVFIVLGAIYTPQIGEEQNPAVRGGYEEMFYNIVAAQLSA